MKNPFGSATPTAIAGYGLVLSGIALLIGGRLFETLRSDGWTATALFLIGLSCLVDALLPGGSEMTPEQIALVRHIGLPYRDGAHKVVSVVVGILFCAGGIYVLQA